MSQLVTWVLYDHPLDHPEFFIVRRWVGEEPEPRAYGFRQLERARAWLEQFGLCRLSRYEDDAPRILEVWV